MPSWAESTFTAKVASREPRRVCVQLSVERPRQVPRGSRRAPRSPDEGDAYGYALRIALELRDLAMAFLLNNTQATPAPGLPSAIEEIRAYAPEVPILWETPDPKRHPEILPLVDAVIINPYLGKGYHQDLFLHPNLGILGCCRDDQGSDEFQTRAVLQKGRAKEDGRWHVRTKEVPFFQDMAQTIGLDWNKGHFQCGVYARTGDISEIAAIRSSIKDLPLFVEPPHGISAEEIAQISQRCAGDLGGNLFPVLSSKSFSSPERECSTREAASILLAWEKAMQETHSHPSRLAA